jgi:hypothetical protein
MRPNALFICGSINQTTQLHAVSRRLLGFRKAFTPFYGTRLEEGMRRAGLNEATICGDRRRGWCLDYLRDHRLPIELDGAGAPYDLVVTCSDLMVPENIRASRVVVVQEGILDPEGIAYRLCRRFAWLPRWLAGTAMTGLSGGFDRICVASEGYRDHLVARGVPKEKVAVTGIPNFDDCKAYERNAFPERGYVLVCTSDTRETYKRDDVRAFLRRARRIALGRRTIFKLHPNEDVERSTRVIREYFPDAPIYSKGSAEEMIANCDVLVTQWSSTVFVGVALGKEVYTNFDPGEVRRLSPVQNGATSAANIASVCMQLLQRGRATQPGQPERPSAPTLAKAS